MEYRSLSIIHRMERFDSIPRCPLQNFFAILVQIGPSGRTDSKKRGAVLRKRRVESQNDYEGGRDGTCNGGYPATSLGYLHCRKRLVVF